MKSDEENPPESPREIKKEKMGEIKPMDGEIGGTGRGREEREKNRMGEWWREAESEWRRESARHSCLPLVLAMCSVESVLSAASLPKSSLTPETWTKLSFGPFVIATKGCTTLSHTHTHTLTQADTHTHTLIKRNYKYIPIHAKKYTLSLFLHTENTANTNACTHLKRTGGGSWDAGKHTLWQPCWRSS